MYQKFLLLLSVLLLVVSITGCSKAAYQDGTYFAIYDAFDSHSWKPQLEIVVKDGKITEAKMDYVNSKGMMKSKDMAYAKNMKSRSGIAPAKAYKKLEEKIIDKQASNVEAVTGATSTTEWFNELGDAILENAKKGDTSQIVLPMNDTYSASDKADERGYIGNIKVTYEDSKIVKVNYDELDKDKNGKKESDYVNTEMKKASGVSWKDAADNLENQLLEKQSAGAIDSVTGATGLTARFKKLAQEAINKR
jgi:major membrane immunogen (membrane-anchored lipoprotein)